MRIVIKLGTNLLTRDGGLLDENNIENLVEEIGGLLDSGWEVIIVSSGAVGAGCGTLQCSPAGLSIKEKQATASVGQVDLINIFKKYFHRQNRTVGQVLVTAQDLARRRSYLNIRNTLFTLLKMNVVPIINENDTVAVEELKFGDNDRLSAVITSKVDADMLVMMTDVDGLLDNNNKVIQEVDKITAGIEKLAGGGGSDFSVGGMKTKLNAARIVTKMCGVDTYITNGRKRGNLKKIIAGKNPGTVFKGHKCGVSHKKRWIAYGLQPSGKVMLDKGAVSAILEKNASVLAVGVVALDGTFKEGDSVSCLDPDGNEIARGLVNYSSGEIKKIMGKSSEQIKDILGYKDYDEIIHKDNLVKLQ
ncbi:MAG: glutamate 5-kinase [Elusimicrobiota bacterium]